MSLANQVAPNARAGFAGPTVGLCADDAEAIFATADQLTPSWVEVQRNCFANATCVHVQIHSLPDWSSAARWQLFKLITQLPVAPTITIDGTTHKDLFEAVVAAMTGPSQRIAEQARSQQAAIEAAALLYGEAPELAAHHINRRLAELELPQLDERRLIGRIRKLSDRATESWHGHHAQENVKPDPAVAWAHAYLNEQRRSLRMEEDEPVVLRFQGKAYAWDGSKWLPLSKEQHRSRIVRFLQKRGDVHVTEAFVNRVLTHLNAMTMIDRADATPPFKIHSLDPTRLEPRQTLAVRNGVLDVEALTEGNRIELAPLRSSHFMPPRLPCTFDPDATCPRWLQTLQQILPKAHEHDRRIDVLQELCGYTLIGDCRFETIAVFTGDGGNGKSTVLRILAAMLGAVNVSELSLDQLGHKYYVGLLAEKLANISYDADESSNLNEAVLKQLASGEALTGEAKFENPFRVHSTAKLFISSNRSLDLSHATRALWRRLLIVPFHVQFDQDDAKRNLAEQLVAAELPGILNWALAGAQRLLRVSKFTDCRCCRRALEAHRAACDTVAMFFEDCCEMKPGNLILGRSFYALYVHYCKAMLGPDVRPLGHPQFGQRLHELDRDIEKGKLATGPDQCRRQHYKHVGLSPDGRALWEELWKVPR